jgi:hypothetical protein
MRGRAKDSFGQALFETVVIAGRTSLVPDRLSTMKRTLDYHKPGLPAPTPWPIILRNVAILTAIFVGGLTALWIVLISAP